jgi:DNA (cytosine-5)-methyltransferase 1
MKYGSVCSGVEAATVAWHSLGWQPQWFSEIEKFPSAVLKHHYPAVPNHGDMTKFKEWNDDRPIDVLVGGTPCQSFSVAGLRKGLDDPRGNLMLTYLAIVERYAPKWIVWENVPGVLSSNRGRDFGTFLGALGQLGYGFAYRVLDAQYFGVAQRRKRVFVVGYLGDWRRAAAVLFERESLRGYPAPSRKTREEIAGTIKASTYSGGAGGKPEGAAVNHFITARMRGFGDYSSDGTASTVKARDYKDATDLVSVGYTSSSFANYKEGIGTVRASGGDLSAQHSQLSVKHTICLL